MLQAMLDFEGALAKVAGGAGRHPARRGDAIRQPPRRPRFDAARDRTRSAGVRDRGDSARQGADGKRARATTPTARGSSTGARPARTSPIPRWRSCCRARGRSSPPITIGSMRSLRQLSERHARTVMLARTLLQPAPPITFGLKAARLGRGARARLARVDASPRRLRACVQFGGASGTLAALGDRGLEVASALADELGLATPGAPWHTAPRSPRGSRRGLRNLLRRRSERSPAISRC